MRLRLVLAATLAAALAGWLLVRGEVVGAIGTALLAGLALWPRTRRAWPEREPDAAPSAGVADRALPLLAALPDPVIVVDRRSIVTAANAPAEAVAPGLRPGYPLALALRAPQVLDAIPRVAATGGSETVEFGGRVATEPTFEARLTPLGRDGAAVVLILRDLTAQRRSERMRVDFVANVSHELRTPLASILGFIETLQGPARNDGRARERFLGIMLGQAQRMKGLIDDLLALSRVDMRAHVPPSGSVDLGSTVAHIVEVMNPLAREREVSIATTLPEEPVLVTADREEMLRVIENLLANAIKYGGSGGRVEVEVRRSPDGRAAEIAVRDHGPGIPAEHLPRLTERFYRVDVAESRAQGGTGLGLAIVKGIVTRHRGRLLVDSEPGRGAVFTVRLPLAPAP